jgi:hypothetical protein
MHSRSGLTAPLLTLHDQGLLVAKTRLSGR